MLNRNSLIAGQASFSFAGFLFGQAARFGFNLLVARALGADALGIYALAVAVIQIAEVIALAGLDSALLRFVSMHGSEPLRQRASIGSALKAGLFFSIAVLLLLLLFSGSIASLLHGSSLLQLAICCYAAAIPFNVATVLFGHAMQGFRQLKPKIIATQVLSPFLLLGFTILFRYTAGGDVALLFPFALAGMGAFFWIRPSLKRICGVLPAVILHAQPDRVMLLYALPFMGVSLLSMVSHWLDIMMLGMLTNTATVGLYHPAARTAGLINAVLMAFAGIAAPMIAELHSGNQNLEIGRIYKMVTRWIVAVAFPPVILFMLLPDLVLGIFGVRFVEGSTALLLLTGAAFLHACFGLATTVLAMTGYARLSLINALVALGLQVLLNFLFIPGMGINGAALATLLLFIVLTVVRLMEIHHLLHIHPFAKALWKPVVSAFIVAVLIIVVRPWLLLLSPFAALAVGVLVTLCLYMALMLLLKLEAEEREIILKLMPFINKRLKR